MNKSSCKTCKWWESGKECGKCHRNPPYMEDDNDGYEYIISFPRTTQDDWCGEWEEKK